MIWPGTDYAPGANVIEFGLPASWEDMEFLGLNPETGEEVDGGAHPND